MLCQAWELRAGKSAACPTPWDRYREGAGEWWKETMMAKRAAARGTRGSLPTRVCCGTGHLQLHITGGKDLDLTRGWQTQITQVTDIYMYISPRRSARPLPLEAKPAGFPRERGHTGEGREQMCSTSSTWALGHSATTTVLYQQPGTVLLGVSHLGAVTPPAEVCWEAGTQGRCTLTFTEERWQRSPFQSLQSTQQEGSTKEDLPRSETPQQPLWDHIPTRPAMSPTVRWDQEGWGQGRPGTVSMGTQRSLWFGGNLGGSWSHLLACSLYKYLLRGQDIKSTVQ